MYRLTRTSSEPASPLKIMIAKPDGPDAGLSAGGSFVLDPGDSVQVDPYVAKVIMGDPGLAPHFDCLPPWPPEASQPPVVKDGVGTVKSEPANAEREQPRRPPARRY